MKFDFFIHIVFEAFVNKLMKTQLEEANKRLSKTRLLLLCGDIEVDDYSTIKAESEERINRLEAKLSALGTNTTNIEFLWDKAISSISNLNVLYKKEL